MPVAQHLLASLVRSAVGGFGSLGAFLAVLCYQVDTIVPVTPGQPTPFERKPTTLDLTFTAETHNCDTPSGPPSLALSPPATRDQSASPTNPLPPLASATLGDNGLSSRSFSAVQSRAGLRRTPVPKPARVGASATVTPRGAARSSARRPRRTAWATSTSQGAAASLRFGCAATASGG